MTDWTGRIVAVTGGSSGIGLATAELFAEHGATLVIVGRDQARLDAAAARLPGAAVTVAADVSTLAGIDAMTDRIRDEFGRLDVLFANAGLAHAPEPAETDEAAYDLLMDTNVKSVFFGIVRALPLMGEGGSIVVTSSVAEGKGRPADPLYAAGKAAVRSLVRTLALDDAVLARKVRINAVTPGCVATPLTAQDDPAMQTAIDTYVASAVPMARWGQAAEVARAVLFLADGATYTTGSEIVVDGGLAQA